LEQRFPKTSGIIVDGLKLLLTIPFFVCGFIFNCIPFLLPVYIRKRVIKAQYEGFFSSLQFAIGIIIFPLFYLLQTALFCTLVSAPLWVYPIFFVLQYPLGKSALKWYSECRKYNAKVRYRKLMQKKSSELSQAQNLREQIIQLIS